MSNCVDEFCATPLSQRTTKCWLTQRRQRKLVDSLPWGIPTVVVYRQIGAQATNLMVTQDTNKVFIQVWPPCGRNTYVLRLIVLIWDELNCVVLSKRVPCLSLYSPESRVTNLATNPSRLQLP